MSGPSRAGSVIRAAALAFALAFAGRAAAEEPSYSSYELAVIEKELARRKARIEPAPEGKRIARIEFARLEVLDESDPVPDFFNVFHVVTRERVVRRELLFAEGQPFSSVRADETARNLRRLRQLSLVLIVPLADPDPDQVRVLVITKDVWSLRLNSNVQGSLSQLDYVLLNPSEENAFGTHARVGGLFILQRYTYSTGLLFSHNRLFGTPLSAGMTANLIFDRETGESEGSFGSFNYGLPQTSADQRWAFLTALWWTDSLQRRPFRPNRADRPEPGERALWLYRGERYVGATEVTRSYGLRHKLDVTGGVEADRRAYRPRQRVGATLGDLQEFVREEVPMSDVRISPYLQLQSYENRFLKTIELETLGLQEDYRLGHDVVVRAYPASTHVGSSRDMLGVSAGLAYTLPLGNGLIRALARSTIEYADRSRHDALLGARLRVASPRFGFGRLIVDGVVENRYLDYLRRQFSLGREDRLRGYASSNAELATGAGQRGNDAVALNTELRTAAIDILSAQCGLAAFHDMGGAADTLAAIELKQSLGLGVRILFPQVNRIVFRADWAFPVSAGYDPLPGGFFFTFGQAFLMPELASPSVATLFVE